MVDLILLTQTIKKASNKVELKEAVLDALYDFGDNDCDFNGENGIEYLWEEAKGFENNRDYLLNKVSSLDTVEKMIYEYFNKWLGADNYYAGYDYNIIRNEANEIIAIALSYYVD